MKARVIYFNLIFIILFIPFLQSVLHFSDVKPLQGAVVLSEDTVFSFKDWFSGHFQEKKEKYINDNFGYRNIFVRLNNQLAFWMFNKANAKNVRVGKDNYLFEKPYIDSYFGVNLMTEEIWKTKLSKFKYIQDSLAKINKTLILVIAPSKAYFYPEYIPDSLKLEKKVTNYELSVKLMNDLKIKYIDFNKYSIENKNKSKYCLYPKLGVHWSNYSALLAADSIIKYIENDRSIIMPHLFWDKIETSEKPKYTDADLADGMNLLFDIKSNKLAYPNLSIKKSEACQTPKLLVIGDSFYWGICNFRFTECFSENKFWYYNETVYPESFEKVLSVKDLRLKDEIKKFDVIIIVCSAFHIEGMGWDFIENTYNILAKGMVQNSSEYWNEVKKIKEKMTENNEWLNQIKQKALDNKIPLDSMMTLDAIWMIQNQ